MSPLVPPSSAVGTAGAAPAAWAAGAATAAAAGAVRGVEGVALTRGAMDAPREPAGASATHSARAASTASLNVLLWATLMALWADAFCVRWLWKFEKPFTLRLGKRQ